MILPIFLSAEDGLTNARFQLDHTTAILGDKNVSLNLSIDQLPENAKIKDFSFSLTYKPKFLSLQDINPAYPTISRVYMTSCQAFGEWITFRFDVYNSRSLSPDECLDILSFGFWPKFHHITDQEILEDAELLDTENNPDFDFQGIADKDCLLIPVTLKLGEEPFILSPQGEPVAVETRNTGSIRLLLNNGIQFDTQHAAPGETVTLPLDFIIQSECRYLNIGIDYDEDMVELNTLSPSLEWDSLIKTLDWSQTGNHIDISIEFWPNAFNLPPVQICGLNLAFNVNPDVPYGSVITIGDEETMMVRYDGEASPCYRMGKIVVDRLPKKHFLRGDVNADDKLNTSDVISILSYISGTKADIMCLDAADVNDDGGIDLSDATCLLAYFFSMDLPPAYPFPKKGLDPTQDFLPDCTLKNGVDQ